MSDDDIAKQAHPDEVRSPQPPTEISVTELCANHPNLREYIAQLESRHDVAQARIAAAETQIMVMRDEEAQRVKLKAIAVSWEKNRNDDEARAKKAVESVGISTHWDHTSGKTIGAMVLELVEVVKQLRGKQ